MSESYRWVRKGLLVALLGCLTLGASGCGYLKNVRDDAMDLFILGVGYVPAVVPTEDGTKAVGFLPPAIGAYVEVTSFLHLGLLFKATADIDLDRRAWGLVVDQRFKAGLGPLHYVSIKQDPIFGNAYKSEGNQMDGWREHMRQLKDPVFRAPAKELIFDRGGGLPWLYRGWQDWEVIQLELAFPTPFTCHSGFAFRIGCDLSQVVDFALGLVAIDFYDDNAYTFMGELQHTLGGE